MWWLWATLALGQDLGFAEDACPVTHPNFQVFRGTGAGRTPEEARKAARDDARRQASEAACGGFALESDTCRDLMSAQAAYGEGQVLLVGPPLEAPPGAPEL